MLLNNYLKFKKQETLLLILLFLFSFIVRIPIILFFGDTAIENEWYPLLKNLKEHNILAVEEFNGFLLPNLWMPPLYAYFLYVLSFFNFENANFVLFVLFVQNIMASISVIFFFKINKNFFSKKISIFNSFLFSFFPIYLYACSQISSISLTIFLSTFFYFFFFKILSNSKYIYLFLFSVIGGLLILVRREFMGIILLSGFYLLFFSKVNIKKNLLILLITLLTISPYLVRNYLTFDKIIIHSGFGYNLWKASNQKAKVDGSEFVEKDFQAIINQIPINKFYRLIEDDIYKKEAIKNISEDPKKYLILYVKRALSYIFININSSDPKYNNPLNIFPLIILGITSLIGVFISDKKSVSLNYVIIIFLFYIFLFSFFAIQPRYKIYIIPFQIIFTGIFIKKFLSILK